MADNDYHIIKPVENLQNAAGLAGVKRREERKRRRGTTDERPATNDQRQASSDKPPAEPQADRHSIDYCA